MRSIKWALALAAAAITVLTFNAASAQGTLRIGMTASDIPLTTGQTDQGGEGMRFMGYTVYDGLINWDLSSFDKPSDLVPGLATSYGVDPADASKNKWIFKIREGVKFHDGSEFTADTAVWNFDKLLKNDSPQFDQRQSAQGRSRIPSVASYKAVDKYTLEIVTKSPDASLPYQLAWIMMSSPAQWEKLGKSWEAFAKTPSGTGPWKLTLFAPRERAEMVPNKEYWDKARIPKLDKLVLLPLPEPNARVAALRAGQVDWIEAPAPDAVASLKSAGFKIITNAYPHNWTWHLSRVEGSPWNDIRVRKAANLAIDREGMQELLSGLMIPAEGFMPPGHQWFGKPTFKLKYEPAEAKKLLKEAGYGPGQASGTESFDLAVRLGPDAAAADERIHPAEPRRGRDQGRLRGGGMESAHQYLARGSDRPERKGRPEPQLHLLHPGSVHRIHPAHAMQPESAERHQLGSLLRPRDGQAAR